MNHILTAVLALIITMHPCNGQTIDEKKVSKRIDNYLSAMEQVGFYGSVLVAIDGEKVISKGYGFSDVEKQIRNSPNTIFDIGSITKQFTAAAILKLEMQGKLSTSDRISKFFDNLPADKQQITIHDLLRHQSGLISTVGSDFEKITKEEFLQKVTGSDLLFPVGSSFSYSNVGYSLLAMIIEKISHQSYETYLYENLWKPSQMEMTGYKRPAFDKNLVAVGYENDQKVWGKPTDKAWDTASPYWHLKGNGGILSTTGDLYKWHLSLLTEKVLSKDAKQKLYHPQLRAEETENSYYAYGWDISKTNRNTTQVWHNGTNRILYADFLRFIDENVTFIMLSNKSHNNFNHLNFEMARLVFDSHFTPEIPAADNTENRAFSNHIIKTIAEFGLEKAKEEYATKKSTQQLLEFLMREQGFNHLDSGKPEIAIQIFEMNAFVYPASAKALQGLGEGYMETGKKELALKYLKESLGLNPDNPFVNRLIEQLNK